MWNVPPGGLQRGESIKEFFIPSRWHFFVYYFLGGSIVQFSILLLIVLGGLVPICAIIFGGLLIWITEIYRRGHRYYVTNQRIIREKTFIGREVREMSYDLMTNITFQQTLAARILGIGTVMVQTASGEVFSFAGVSEPDRIKAAILRQKQAFLEAAKPVVVAGGEKVEYNYCPKCGARLGAEVKYCPNCGEPILERIEK